MKPCSRNRKLLVWLAMDALDAEQGRPLRVHLETCAGCRRYLDEISTVRESLGSWELAPDLEGSPAFHRRWVSALHAGSPAPVWGIVAAHLRGNVLSWRVVLPALGATALLILTLATLTHRPHAPTPAQASAPTVPPPALKADLPPTLSNYQMAAHQSLEALDELLTRQGIRSLPPARVYTVSTFALADALD